MHSPPDVKMLCIDEVVNINNLPPPQKRPALSIAPEYRGLRLSDMEGGGKEEEGWMGRRLRGK